MSPWAIMEKATSSVPKPERTDSSQLLVDADPGKTGATILDAAFRRPANEVLPLTPQALAARALATMREPARPVPIETGRAAQRMGAEQLPVSATIGGSTHYREIGAGPFVLCIHSFSSSSNQYQALMQRLAPRFRVVAADLYGHGRSTSWLGERRFTLADEAAPLEALLPDDDTPVHLVGHSYGAAVALRIAAANRVRVRSMALYEPTMWGTLSHLCPSDPATLEIEAVRDDTIQLIDEGRVEAAAERFIDYWSGPGSWAAIPGERRPRLVTAVRSLRAAWSATFVERWSATALRSLDTPCLLVSGTHTTAAARRATGLLRDTLPTATVVEFEGLGHLGPITHSERVDAAIDTFLSSSPMRSLA
ncbi:MAG TPA: alpha/beta fold hydrolase [Burkholderiales bacterium]|nr:alpha/beta fold hydrolase [Burkholderiales bacterium]